MNMQVVGRHIELTDPIKEYIDNAVETLNKYNLDIISIRAICSAEEKKGKHGVSIEFTINLPHKNTIVIKQRDKDLYAAIDIAISRAQKVLSRHHDKIKEHKSLGQEQNSVNQLDEIHEGEEDEIVPMDLDLHKPLDVEEALEMLKDGKRQFIIFNDHDNKTRVLHKRNDNRYGLY
ncbi:MAG: ribosome-associated translation inhibitor RaiA [Thiovulaceae bacterium]|nr:ribosome-associated translation inhibitor RaiA [Sulfurimonadaceae bacterium]